MAKQTIPRHPHSLSLKTSSPTKCLVKLPYEAPTPSTLSSRTTSLPPALIYRPKSTCLIFPVLTAVIFSPAVPDHSFAITTESPSQNPRPTTSTRHPRCGSRKMPSKSPPFICTFCWTPQMAPAKPKVVGRHGRIACHECWKSILDLSICWVCGEMVVRGEEVVSLGWCFWHRACFGCLLCGASLRPPMVDELYAEGGRYNIRTERVEEITHLPNGRKFRGGVELETIPLCVFCEDAVQDLKEPQILENGLGNIDKRDGGLSRSRLHMMATSSEVDDDEPEQKGRTLVKTQRKKQDVTASEKVHSHVKLRSTKGYPDAGLSASLIRNAADITMLQDGNGDAYSRKSSTSSTAKLTTEDPMYVSVFDPINGPSFQPSRTKPLPRWMAFLPTNRQWPQGSGRIVGTDLEQLDAVPLSLGDDGSADVAVLPKQSIAAAPTPTPLDHSEPTHLLRSAPATSPTSTQHRSADPLRPDHTAEQEAAGFAAIKAPLSPTLKPSLKRRTSRPSAGPSVSHTDCPSHISSDPSRRPSLPSSALIRDPSPVSTPSSSASTTGTVKMTPRPQLARTTAASYSGSGSISNSAESPAGHHRPLTSERWDASFASRDMYWRRGIAVAERERWHNVDREGAPVRAVAKGKGMERETRWDDRDIFADQLVRDLRESYRLR
jgi:hypothetical protein